MQIQNINNNLTQNSTFKGTVNFPVRYWRISPDVDKAIKSSTERIQKYADDKKLDIEIVSAMEDLPDFFTATEKDLYQGKVKILIKKELNNNIIELIKNFIRPPKNGRDIIFNEYTDSKKVLDENNRIISYIRQDKENPNNTVINIFKFLENISVSKK